ncbi:MAG: phage major capsid protein [Bradyrhizobium sp.]|nr:phage major capsid protein [Bradyrhizobium sp.]
MNIDTLNEIKSMVESQGTAWKADFDSLKAQVREIELKAGRAPLYGMLGGSTSSTSSEMKAFYTYMRSGQEPERKSMISGSDPQGGYLIPTEIDTELTKYQRMRSPMRQLARVVQVGGAEFKEPHSTLGTTYSWVGEVSARPETTAPSFKMVTIPTCEIYAAPQISQNLLDDNDFDLGNWITTELGDAFGDGEADAFINGSGVSRPRGLFTYDVVATTDPTRDHDKFQYVPTGGSGDWAGSNPSDALIALVHAVKPQYRANASWLLSGEVIEAVRKFKAAATGDYIWQPSTQAGQPNMLLGFPVFEDENLPAIASNSLSAAFGDFSRSYTITDRSTTLLRDPFTAKPYVVFYGTKRLGGGGGRDTRAVKFLKFASS